MGKLHEAMDDKPQGTRRIHIVDKFYATIRWVSQPEREKIMRKCRERFQKAF